MKEKSLFMYLSLITLVDPTWLSYETKNSLWYTGFIQMSKETASDFSWKFKDQFLLWVKIAVPWNLFDSVLSQIFLHMYTLRYIYIYIYDQLFIFVSSGMKYSYTPFFGKTRRNSTEATKVPHFCFSRQHWSENVDVNWRNSILLAK